MPNRLADIKRFIEEQLPASEQREKFIAILDNAREDFELLEFKVNKYISEKDVVIRMLENNVLETQEQKTELEEINRLLVQQKSEIQRQNSDLEYAMQLARAGIKAKSDFLSTMSHEIRSPLNAIIGMSYILLQDNPKPEQINNLNILQFSAENLMSLINDILDFSKIESGVIEFENEEFDLINFIKHTYGMFNVKAQDKNIKLRCLMDPALPKNIKGDSVRLGQILNNLLSNAIKFTEVGSVTLEVSLSKIADNKCWIDFRVIDTGIGIDEAKHQTIFERFLQEDSQTSKVYGGTGLGLAIIKNLLQLMGSKINLKSRKGQGATFYFTLAFELAEVEHSTMSFSYNGSPKDFRKLSGLKVLVVDDNEFNITVAKTYLENWSVDFDLANDGIPAVEKAQQKEYNIILMDLQMPYMNGMEAAMEMRKTGLNIHTPIIALSATVTTTIKEEVLEAGMNDYLSKPFNPKELHHKLYTVYQSTKKIA